MRLIDADALKANHGMKDACSECDKEVSGFSKSCQYDTVYTLMDFCGWIDDAPTVTINDHPEEIKVTNCNYNADTDKKVSSSWGHENGLIKRQDALDALGEEPPVWYDGEDEIAERNQWRRDVNAIKAVPSVQPEIIACGSGELIAQPETNCSENPNGSDAISRESAIVQTSKVIQDDAVAHDVKEVLKNLPPVHLPRWVQKVEKYHEQALKMPHIKKHRAWALYQAYKEYNRYGK